MNKIFHSTLKPKHQNLKNRNIDKGILLQRCFSFEYAGKAQIFLDYRKGKYRLIIQGVNIVENIYCFSPHVVKRYEFEKLYTAIKAFNIVVSILVSTMDWYDEDSFSYKNIYEEIFFKD